MPTCAGVRCPRVTPTCRPRRTPRAQRRRASRNCAARPRARGRCERGVTSVSALDMGMRLRVRLTNGGTLRILKRRDPPISSGGSLHFITTGHKGDVLPWLPRSSSPLSSASSAPASPPRAPDAAAVLGIILACYLMIVLDISVIIAALPKIHRALHFSPTGLSWVQNAYTLTFGGLLLLGARAGDILGRRRMLVDRHRPVHAASWRAGWRRRRPGCSAHARCRASAPRSRRPPRSRCS